MPRYYRSGLIIFIIVFLAGLAFAGPQFKENIRSIFKNGKSATQYTDQILEKSRQIKKSSQILCDLTGPRQKNKKRDHIKIKEEAENLEGRLTELKRVVHELDTAVSKIYNESKSLKIRKCPVGYHWVPEYTTPSGRHIKGHCKPNKNN